MKKILGIRLLFILSIIFLLASCGKRSKEGSSLTGWNSKDMQAAGFSKNDDYKGEKAPPGMVLIEGGAFTMGHVQDDVLFDWNTTPSKIQIRSFYLDETEVTNSEYLFYLDWLERVFPPSETNYKYIYSAALPDTLVWRNTLGANELLTENYLRHPAYADYPVVGVSWIQANQYCKWRTDVVNEKILIQKGVLKNLYRDPEKQADGKNRFDAAAYKTSPTLLYEGDESIYKKGLKEVKPKVKGATRPEKGSFTGRHIKVSDGIMLPDFRLPTEAEWEYAAKATVENREYNNIRGRKKYAWEGKYTRNKSRKYQGDQLANFKQGKGDYSGIAGWSNDGADITIRVKSYAPNSFGLYDMSGNVAEWVQDVYRPIIDNDANDFNYFRGNTFNKRLINQEGKVVVVDYNNMVYDTLDNGKIIPRELPGSIKYIPITDTDAFMRNNYTKAYNKDSKDGDLASTKFYNKDTDQIDPVQSRMYNAPIIPKLTGEDGNVQQEYDKELRNTLISDQARVFKGGSWQDREYWLDPAQRRYLPEYMASSYIGFRCAMDKLGPMTHKRRKPFNIKL
ncbi:MAG: gliding motility lipoprotein GldJ [Flavobacteriaceae bacterium]|nr:gliding motility lipoprotein GldJ [Flavobacteriaceae bacterium]